MATIKLCDWTKKRLTNDEPTFTVSITDDVAHTDVEFEVGAEGRAAILSQLEGESAPGAPIVRVIEKTLTTPRVTLETMTPDGDFEPGPGSMPVVQGSEGDPGVSDAAEDGVPPLEIPIVHARKRLKAPTMAQADKVIQDSTIFAEGGLPSLAMGAPAHKIAMRKQRDREEKKAEREQRSAGHGIRINHERIQDKPGYSREY